MKLSNQKILNDASRLGTIAQKQLPVKVSFAIAKNISKIESVLEIYNKERQKLIDKYTIKDENDKVVLDENGQATFREGCRELWEEDIKELLVIENEIAIHKFNINDLNNQIMTPSEIMLIEYMIEE